MKKLISILCALLLILTVAAGCSRGKSEEQIKAIIKSNLDILAQDNPYEIIEKTSDINSELFDEIVALGEDALPFLELIADRGSGEISWFPDVEFEHRLWAVYAIYAIKPENYDMFSPSPDGEYTARLKVESFRSFYNYGQNFNVAQIINNATGEIVCEADMNDMVNHSAIFHPKILWSPNSDFAIIECNGQRWGNAIAINVQTKDVLVLPDEEAIINHVFPGENYELILSVPRFWFWFDSWKSDEIVKISYNVGVIMDNQDLKGWYTYDLTQRKILDIEYSVEEW